MREEEDAIVARAKRKAGVAGGLMLLTGFFILSNVGVNAVLSQLANAQIGPPPGPGNDAAFRAGQMIGLVCMQVVIYAHGFDLVRLHRGPATFRRSVSGIGKTMPKKAEFTIITPRTTDAKEITRRECDRLAATLYRPVSKTSFAVVSFYELRAASIIARIPVRIAAGSVGQASISRAKSGHFSTSLQSGGIGLACYAWRRNPARKVQQTETTA
jgi:hypothetical protein